MCKHGDYLAQKEPLRLPGGMPVRPEDLIDPMTDCTKQEYNVFLQTRLKIVRLMGFCLTRGKIWKPQRLKH
jgi:hypothetical protein